MKINFDPFSTAQAAGGLALNTISSIFSSASAVNDAMKQHSLVELTSSARVEPLTVVGSDCLHVDCLPDVLQSLQSIFSGYYLQAVALTNQVGDIKVVKLLDRLNPNRQVDIADIRDVSERVQKLAKEGLSEKTISAMAKYNYGMEAYESANTKVLQSQLDDAADPEKATPEADKPSASIDEKATYASVTELANLSVGKLLKVTIKNGGESIVVPIAIRLMVNQIPDRSLEHILTLPTEKVDVIERYHEWRAGRISLIRDLMLCQDLIKEHKKALMQDKSGVYAKIMSSATTHAVAGATSRNVSLASASNLFVISEATAARIETKLGGKFSSPQFRDKIFGTGYGMIIAVIDREFDRVTFYHRGIASYTDVSVRDIKASNKGGGPDVGDILKAYIAGNSPSL